MHVAGLRNGAAGEATACLCLLSMRVIGSYTMYIVLDSKYSGFQCYTPKASLLRYTTQKNCAIFVIT